MMQPFTLDEFKQHAKTAGRVAIFAAFRANDLTPIRIYKLLSQFYGTEGILLEDLHHSADSQRLSFICFEPMAGLSLPHPDFPHPLSAIRELQAKFAYATRPEVAAFITSAAGFMSYDAIRYFEDIPDRHASHASMPSVLLNFYALNLTFDHEQQTLLISQIVEVGPDAEQIFEQARAKIETLINYLTSAPKEMATPRKKAKGAIVEMDLSDADFMLKVEKAKEYIMRGDAFQIVLSRCFKRKICASPLEIYKSLCQVSPAPFMFYFPLPTSVIIGASPERLIRVHNQQITANPIAGTRQRSNKSDKTDEAIAHALLSDKKELAEHMMLVDLARNDVGAVSKPGSVFVNELLRVKHYSHVSHITSTVTGQLDEKYDALDAFIAAFPAGTLSGAPKIRAMQIIDELETSRRGLYGGAIFRLNGAGHFDSCIAIRSAVLKDGIATIRTGAGIVHDSNPAKEAKETQQKALALLAALAQAHGESSCY